MFTTSPTFFLATIAIVVAIMFTVGMNVLWALFALTLIVTTSVAIWRTIPRRER
ncbi:MAG TPA: hypothetical protein VFZ00_26965 [Solirubrobacter sp.]|nr:hypothetical protein [Solirubrobacter sp.]